MCSGSKLRQVWVCPGHLQHRQTAPSRRHGVPWGPTEFFPNEFPHLLWHPALQSSSLGAWQNARSSCTDSAGFSLCDFGQASLPLWDYVSNVISRRLSQTPASSFFLTSPSFISSEHSPLSELSFYLFVHCLSIPTRNTMQGRKLLCLVHSVFQHRDMPSPEQVLRELC